MAIVSGTWGLKVGIFISGTLDFTELSNYHYCYCNYHVQELEEGQKCFNQITKRCNICANAKFEFEYLTNGITMAAFINGFQVSTFRKGNFNFPGTPAVQNSAFENATKVWQLSPELLFFQIILNFDLGSWAIRILI